MTADRLRVEVAARSKPFPVTISAGVASFPDQATSGADLMAMADAALYEAKRSGRNRVVVASRSDDAARADQVDHADHADHAEHVDHVDHVDLRQRAPVVVDEESVTEGEPTH
jgi:predicted signal transduction protein with EAL and GGDEF domain